MSDKTPRKRRKDPPDPAPPDPPPSDIAGATALLCEPQQDGLDLAFGLTGGEIVGMRLESIEGARLVELLMKALDRLPEWRCEASLAAWREQVDPLQIPKPRRRVLRRGEKPGRPRPERPEMPFPRASGHYLKITGFGGDPSLRKLPILAGFSVNSVGREHRGGGGGVLLACRHKLTDTDGKIRPQDLLIHLPFDEASREARVLGGRFEGRDLHRPDWLRLSRLRERRSLELEGTTLRRLRYHDFARRVSHRRYRAVTPEE